MIVIDCNMRSVVEGKYRDYLKLDDKIRSNFVDDICLHSHTFKDMENNLKTKRRWECGKVGLKIYKNKTESDNSKFNSKEPLTEKKFLYLGS